MSPLPTAAYLVEELTELQLLSAPLQLVNGKAHLHWQGYVQGTATYLHSHASSHKRDLAKRVRSGGQQILASCRHCRLMCQLLPVQTSRVSKPHEQLLEESTPHHMLENLPDVAAGGQLWLCVRKALAPVWDRCLILPP